MSPENSTNDRLRYEFLKDQVDRLERDYKAAIERMDQDMRERVERCVPSAEFDPVKRIVYGLVSLILIGVVTGILALIMRAPTS